MLTIYRELVEMMDGGIRVDSEPGAGTSVRFDFRLRINAGTAQRDLRLKGLGDFRTLVVDANAAAVCRRALDDLGAPATVAYC